MSSKFQEFLQGFESTETTNESDEKNIESNHNKIEEKPKVQKNIKLKLKLNVNKSKLEESEKNEDDIRGNNSNNNNVSKNITVEDKKDITEISTNENKINLEKLFLESETDERFKEKWMSVYEKAINSNKKNSINAKVREGKFRIDKDGNIEIMPEFETYGKSSKLLLNQHWQI